MPNRRIALVATSAMDGALDRISAELDVPTAFPDDVLAEADVVVARGPQSPPGAHPAVTDRRDIPFVTIDPEGSRDLDQAYHAARRARGGYRVHYAIADVAAFVAPGRAIDAEAHRRGLTRYLPGRRASLHPEAVSQGAASLLPDGDRRALLWTIDLDAEGTVEGAPSVERATVRSRAMRTYREVQDELDRDAAEEPIVLLREVGERRKAQEAARGGIDLRLPTQVVALRPDGAELQFEVPLPVEAWNAQISLLTGIVAAHRMLDAGIGVLRTLPPPQDDDLDFLRRRARALDHPWPKGTDYPSFVRGLDPATPTDAALLLVAARTLRGAGSTVFDGAPPELSTHAAVASPYAHVTAPLRRLADRYANEIVLAVQHGVPVAEWVHAAMPALPGEMAEAYQRERALERAVVDAAEALTLAPHVGEQFTASVVGIDRKQGKPPRVTIQLRDPAVSAVLTTAGQHDIGAALTVRLESVDVPSRTIRFVPA